MASSEFVPDRRPRRRTRTAALTRRRRSRRRATVAALLIALAGLVAVAAAVVPPMFGPAPPRDTRLAGAADDPGPTATGAPTPVVTTPSGTPTAAPEPPLRLAGSFPSAGSGSFAFVAGQGPVAGRAGQLRRYRVAVERGSGEDVAEFGAAVERALGDQGGWTAGGRLRLRRVPDGAGHDFTVYLATAQTAGQLCAAGGVDIRIGGRPYTSCRATGKVIINLERWRRSVDHFVEARVPLDTYRDYVINHEVGHELGFGHERCPGRGRPAPVMMQQTLFLDGCVANPWPYLDGRRYSGPSL
nr:DUF3152 domain-containing protein [Micromonospora sp. DSM 115978]